MLTTKSLAQFSGECPPPPLFHKKIVNSFWIVGGFIATPVAKTLVDKEIAGGGFCDFKAGGRTKNFVAVGVSAKIGHFIFGIKSIASKSAKALDKMAKRLNCSDPTPCREERICALYF